MSAPNRPPGQLLHRVWSHHGWRWMINGQEDVQVVLEEVKVTLLVKGMVHLKNYLALKCEKILSKS